MSTEADPMVAEHPARLENLPRFMSFIEDACRRVDADDDATYALRLAVEEVCINLIRYGYKNMAPGPIRLAFASKPGEITVRIHDRARPFDPSQAPPPDLTSDVESRPVGGLGWYLVKQFVDRIEYKSHPQQGNELALTKRTAARPMKQEAHTQGEPNGTRR